MALFNSFKFGDVDSKDYGVYISGDSVYDSPARSVDLVQVPGRNGALALDNGYYENIEVTYPAGSFGTSQEEWREKMLGIRNALAAQRGYQKLIDTYHPEHYRLGMFFAGISASPVQYNRAGQFPIRFNCKPQRFLISGDEAVEFTEEGQEEVYGPASIASFEAEEGAEIRELKVNLEPVQDLNGYDNPWPAGGGVNKFDGSAVTTTHSSNWGIDWNSTTNVLTITQKTSYTTGTPTFSLNLPSGTYVASYQSISETGKISLYTDGSWVKSLNNGVTFTLDSTKTNEIRFAAVTVTKFQVESGSSATSFSPYSNICPISGHTEVNVTRTGKNLLASSSIKDNVYISNSTGEELAYTNWSASDYIPIEPNVEYAPRNLVNGRYQAIGNGNLWWAAYDKDFNYLAGGNAGSTITVANDDVAYVRISTQTSRLQKGVFIKLSDVQYFITEADYIDGNVYTISLGQTVYGGTLNVTTGVFTITHRFITLNENSSISKEPTGWAVNETFYISIANYAGLEVGASAVPNIKANQFKEVSYNDLRRQEAPFLVSFTGAAKYIEWTSTSDSVETEKARLSVSPIHLCYELATPTTVQLTPTQVSTLLGTNNIWADAGEVEVTVASPVDLTNPTNFPAKPLIRVYGNGSVRVGDTIATVQNNADGYVDIDCESMNCYDTTGGRNADVSFSGNDFPELASGNNGILLTGPSKIEITPRWWEL